MSLSALVLCAGLGTRLLPLTRTLAKPAVPLAGRTLIERVLDWLRTQHVTDVVINLHHQPHTITGVVGDGAHLGMRVRYSWEQPVLGSAGGPRRALPLIGSDPFLIVNGDTLAHVDLAGMQAEFERHGADVLMAVVPNPSPEHYNGILLDGDHRVTGFVGKGAAAAGSWHFIGIQMARRAVFAPLADGVPEETVANIYRTMVASGSARLFGWPLDVAFMDVGTPADYLEAAQRLAIGERTTLVEAGAMVDPSARLERTVVWPGARIGAGATLTECIVMTAVTVPDTTTARRMIFHADGVTAIDRLR